MLHRLGLVWVPLVLTAACGGEAGPWRVDSDAQPVQLTSDAGVYDAGPFDAGHPDASTWLAASAFSITFDSGACYGMCPHYWVRLDSTGKVSYRGRSSTAKPGYYEVDVPAADAEALRLSLIDAGFLGLQASYQVEADGCSYVATDASTKIFTLETPTQTKQVTFYEGCKTDAAWLFQRLEKQIMRATQVGRFLYPRAHSVCEGKLGWDGHVSWVISRSFGGRERDDIGLLRVEQDYTWKVTTCDGQEISSGSADLHSGWDRFLISPYLKPGPIAWPGTEGPQGVVLLNRTGPESWISVTVLSLFEEQKQYAYKGDSCGGTAP